MKKSRIKEEQIVGMLKRDEAGVKTVDLCTGHGINDATLYNWRAKYSGLHVSEAQQLKQLNRRLKLMEAG